MCLFVNSKHFPDPSVKAVVPVIVPEGGYYAHKILITFQKGECISPFRRTRWEFGKLKTAKMKPSGSRYGRFFINAGLHGYRRVRDARKRCYAQRKTFPCLIPAGSELYWGDRGDFAASQMIVFKNMRALRAYEDAARG